MMNIVFESLLLLSLFTLTVAVATRENDESGMRNRQSTRIDNTQHLQSSYQSTPSVTNVTTASDNVFSSDLSITHPLPVEQTARVPLYLYNPGLARRIGISTLVMGSVLYGITVIPALLAASGVAPFSNIFNALGKRRKRRKRSLLELSDRQMPFLSRDDTRKMLALMLTTLELRKIVNPDCSKQMMCKVYEKVSTSIERPITLSTFQKAIVNTFGVAAVRDDYRFDVLRTVEKYYDSSLIALTGSNCTLIFPCAH